MNEAEIKLFNKIYKFISKAADINVRIVSESEQLKLEAEELKNEIKEAHMKKINPNSFVSFNAKWKYNFNNAKLGWSEVEIIVPWKNIVNMEKFNRGDDENNCFIRVNMIILRDSGGVMTSADPSDPSSYKVVQYKLSETIYEELKSKLALVDFNIPIIENSEQIREIVKEEMAKTRSVSSAISQLDVCTE